MRCHSIALSTLLVLAAGCERLPISTPPQHATPKPSSTAAQADDNSGPELGSFGIDLTARKTSIAAGDDFFGYANGAWLDSYQLKPDEMRFGSFTALSYRAEDQVRDIIVELASSKPTLGSIQQKIADYFASFMDRDGLNDKGIAPLEPELARIDAIQSVDALIDAFGRAEVAGTLAPISSYVDIDRKDPNQHRLNIVHAGLGLPTRDFYLEESFAKTRDAYRDNIATLLGLAKVPAAEAKLASDKVLALEIAIARHHWPMDQLREMDKTYNPRSVAELEREVPGYPWGRHWQAEGIVVEQLGQVNVVTPDALAPLAKLVTSTPLQTWRHYLKYHLVRRHASFLGDAIDDAAFAFFGKILNGQPEQRERWKRAIQLVGAYEGLGEAIGQLYVERHFPPQSKAQMDALVENLRSAFRIRIEKLSWMGAATKQEALAKLEAFNPKIGYPKKWRDFSSIPIDKANLLGNVQAVRKYWHEDSLARLGKPTDRDEWYMTPQEVNAYYNPSFNEIVFPAAILQPPFFDPNADLAVNYGGIGAVIGHEMGHGFDDQGSKSDHAGVQRDWWTDADRDKFEARTRQLVDQYNDYQPLEGHKVNGQLTLGENIGDLGGLAIAYHAYQLALAGKQPPVLEGVSGPQRFFLSWAQVWRLKQRDESLLKQLKSDPHSPARYRVNGVVRNLDAWYAAFDVGPDAALYLPPEQRVSIW